MARHILAYFLLFFAWFSFSEVNATHLRAGDITLTRLSCSSYQYRITLHIYTNVSSPVKFSQAGAGNLDFGDGSNIFHPPEVDNPPVIKSEDGGVGEVIVFVDHTYPGPGAYTIQYYEQNRNAGILNINGSVNVPFFIQTQIIIDPFLGCDNTPQLLVPPIDEGCTGVAWFHNPGAYDPDGDSLSYALFIPKQAENVDVPGYVAPNSKKFYDAAGLQFSQANEAGNGPPTFSINSVTGTITWDAPGEAGEYNIAFLIIEWRKVAGTWVQLGYVERDMQIIINDCHNQRPQLQVPPDLCVLAGTPITQDIFATDPDGSPTSGHSGTPDSVKIEAFSQVFTINPSPATYTPGPSVWQPTISPTEQAHIRFNWQTECAHVKEQPYQVVFKATDNGDPNLATFATWKIRVVAPAPIWTSVTLNPGQRSSQLIWQAYNTQCSTADTIQIWRRVDSYPFTPPTCVTGMPEYLGYTLIAQVPASNTTYTDKGLSVGAKYCYRLVAAFPKPGGGLSYVSQEFCIPPIIADAPVVTNVTIDITDTQAGQITVKWRPPFQANASQFPPPYTYIVERADGISGNINLKAVNPGQLTDTTFVDTGLNTAQNIYNYRILGFASNGGFVDTSAVASSVRLDLKPFLKQVQLNWTANVPWSNNTINYPMHRIYRGTTGATKISDLTLIDSVNVTQTQFTYLDSGQYNNTPLVQTQTYCYAVMTRGSYGNPRVKAPLINFSEITCSQPDDKVPPCKPVLAITAVTCDPQNNSFCPFDGNSGGFSFSNTIQWKRPTDPNCKKDISGYNIYAASANGQTFTKIATLVTDTFYVHSNLASYAQCYKVSAVDRAGNESDLSDQFCFDNCPYYTLPNVFTPNGDGCNDKFSAYSIRNYNTEGATSKCSTGSAETDAGQLAQLKVSCARFVLGVTFTVYNRWGKEVYTYQSGGENTIFIDWNGKDNSGRDLDAGTYYYMANVVFNVVDPKKKNKTIKDWVQIIR